jgi:epoxyqueuosine reductase
MLSGLAIKESALKIGFDLAGIAPIGVWKDLEFSRQWVEEGFNGEMRYLENPKRFDPRLVLPSAKSVICVGLVYNAPQRSQKSGVRSQNATASDGQMSSSSGEFRISSFDFRVSAPAPRAWISRYAWGHDYHEIMRAKLEQLRAAVKGMSPGIETRVFVDTGPVVERAFARFSGIGWVGKNTCIINQEKGSWFFLGVILTNLELAPDLPAPDRCGSCTACLEACPTGALVEPHVMDASRCISYFTIELRGSIPEHFRQKIGANVFGCDICQDVCPWNSSRQLSVLGYQPSAFSSQLSASFSLFNPPLDALASISEDDFRRIFAHSPIKRVKYRGWLRNLCLAMGNLGDGRFIPWLERAAQHADPVVREHAAWALERLRDG